MIWFIRDFFVSTDKEAAPLFYDKKIRKIVSGGFEGYGKL
jgi:hypothetical protein